MLPDPEVLADQILELADQRNPPTDVRAVLSKWPLLSVTETELEGDGFFVDLGDAGGEILIKKSKQETRKRFTLAHELGHFLVRHHLRDQPEKQKVEAWCNNFAAGLLLPKLLVSRHLKSGGLSRLTERLHQGAAVFQVSEQAFYLRVARLFPISIMNVLVSRSTVSVINEYRSSLLQHRGNPTSVLDSEIKAFLTQIARAGSQQHQLKTLDQTWLVRQIYRENNKYRFLLALLDR